MVKVKVIKLDERFEPSEREKERVGKVFEAFLIDNSYEYEEYKKQYALNMGDGVWFLPVDCCEVVEDMTHEVISKEYNNNVENNTINKKVLLVEDGTVDIDYIRDILHIPCIVYRAGAKKPEWL